MVFPRSHVSKSIPTAHVTLHRITWLSRSGFCSQAVESSQDHMTPKSWKSLWVSSDTSQDHMTFKMKVIFTVIKEFTGSHDTLKVQGVLWFPTAHVILPRITWLGFSQAVESSQDHMTSKSWEFSSVSSDTSHGHMTSKSKGFATAHVILSRITTFKWGLFSTVIKEFPGSHDAKISSSQMVSNSSCDTS